MRTVRVEVAVFPQVSVATWSMVSVAGSLVSIVMLGTATPLRKVCMLSVWPSLSIAVPLGASTPTAGASYLSLIALRPRVGAFFAAPKLVPVRVPKTSSALMRGQNRLKWRNTDNTPSEDQFANIVRQKFVAG